MNGKGQIRLRDRILLILYAALGIAVTLGLALMLVGGMRVTLMETEFRLGDGGWPVVWLAVLCALALIWSVRVLMIALEREPRSDRTSVAVQHSENGSVRISLAAMDTLVRRAIGEAEGIVEVKTGIINHEDSISVTVEMTLESDVHIPNITMLMQRSIKNFIEEFSGIAVREVRVMVTKIIEVTPAPPLQLSQGAIKPEVAPPVAEQEPELEPEIEPEVEPEAELEPEVEPEPEDMPGDVPEPEVEPEEMFEPEPDAAEQDDADEREDHPEKDVW